MQSYFSYSNTDAKGVVPTNELQRHNFNFNQSAQFFDNKLKMNASLNYINQNVKNRPAGGLYFNPLTGLYFFPRGLDFDTYKRDFELYNPDRNFNTQNWVADRDIQQNPYWILNRNTNENTRNRFIAAMSARYDITDWLYLQARGNVDRIIESSDQKVFASTQGTLSDFNGRYVLRNIDDSQVYGDVILGINKQLSEDFILDFNLGMSHTRSELYEVFADSKNGDLSFANKFGLQYMKDPIQSTLKETLRRKKKNAVFASAQLGYKNMLYLDITGRNDWSSALPNESYFYPSFGLSWVINEAFDLGGIDYLKLRGSYAIVGNDVPAYETNNRDDKGEVVGGQLELSGVGPIPGTTLQPEESKSFEVGVEFKTWQNRVSLDFAFYKTNTINQFIEVSAPAGSGFERYLVNAGNIQNSGIEAALGVQILDKDFKWFSSLVFTRNVNEVLEIHPEFDKTSAPFFLSGGAVNNYGMAIQTGQAFGDIWGVIFARDDAGRIIIDENGKPKVADPAGGRLGNPNPDYMIGFRNEFSYKNFTLNFLIDGRFGGQIMSLTEALIDEHGVSKRTADARDAGGVTINGVSEVDNSPVTTIDAETWYTAVGGRAGITEKLHL